MYDPAVHLPSGMAATKTMARRRTMDGRHRVDWTTAPPLRGSAIVSLPSAPCWNVSAGCVRGSSRPPVPLRRSMCRPTFIWL